MWILCNGSAQKKKKTPVAIKNICIGFRPRVGIDCMRSCTIPLSPPANYRIFIISVATAMHKFPPNRKKLSEWRHYWCLLVFQNFNSFGCFIWKNELLLLFLLNHFFRIIILELNYRSLCILEIIKGNLGNIYGNSMWIVEIFSIFRGIWKRSNHKIVIKFC